MNAAELEQLAVRHGAALAGLAEACEGLVEIPEIRTGNARALAHGHFRPAEEEGLQLWLARFLTVRRGLWEVVEEGRTAIGSDLERTTSGAQWKLFLASYAAACLVVRLDRFLVEELAVHRLVQRKLNEPVPERRIPRKSFTASFKSLSHPRNALAMDEAMALAHKHRRSLEALGDDADVGFLVSRLAWLEAPLDRSRSRFLGLFARYRHHSLRRRGASAGQQVTFAVLESSGRVVAELGDHRRAKRVSAEIRERIAELLRPGDVIVTRHEGAFSNLFLPGYWPHAALYVGSAGEVDRLGLEPLGETAARWPEPLRVLEALKDGVRFRPLSETLAVDSVAVIRPQIADKEIARAIARAAAHEGKGYNFDFDFFRSDRLVCTEVIYRGLDGVGGLDIELTERAGRPTLSAEDLLDMAADGRGFEPIAVFGPDCCCGELVTGATARGALLASYRGEAR